jgi:hypothetical protein
MRGVGTVASGGSYTRFANSFPYVVDGSSCENVTFQDMTIGDDSMLYAVAWKNLGDTIWENVELQGSGWSWYDACWANGSIGLHYFFDSQATTLALGQAEGFQVACSEFWWYGGGIRFVSDPSVSPSETEVTGIEVTGNGDLRVIGSKIHVVANWGSSESVGAITGVRVRQSGGTDASFGFPVDPAFPSGHGTFHMHGTTLVVDGTGQPGSHIVGISVTEEGHAHTPGAGFDLLPPADGTVERVFVDHSEGGHADSPYEWPERHVVPTIALEDGSGFSTHHGFDLWTETDCDALGRCPGPIASAESHLMIYEPDFCDATSSPGNPWLDTVTGRCRNDSTP